MLGPHGRGRWQVRVTQSWRANIKTGTGPRLLWIWPPQFPTRANVSSHRTVIPCHWQSRNNPCVCPGTLPQSRTIGNCAEPWRSRCVSVQRETALEPTGIVVREDIDPADTCRDPSGARRTPMERSQTSITTRSGSVELQGAEHMARCLGAKQRDCPGVDCPVLWSAHDHHDPVTGNGG